MRQALETLQDLPLLTYMIPMTLIILGFSFGAWAVYWDYRKKQLMYQERRLMIEQGITPPSPPDPYLNTPAGAGALTRKLDHEERRLMIEKGLTPPPKPPKRTWTWQDYLRFGLVTLFLGVGLGIAYLFLIHTGDATDAGLAGAWGAAIGMAGLGLTIYSLIARASKS
jgi:hypothetical protein